MIRFGVYLLSFTSVFIGLTACGDSNDFVSKNDLKQFDIKYKKGLAALVDDEYQDIINSPRMTLITKDEVSDKSLDIWFGKSSDLRKTELLK
jgi:hypothetical protein